MTREGMLAIYRQMWGRELELPAPLPPRPALNVEPLERGWAEARSRLAQALSNAGMPADKLLFHPHLAALETFIKNAWDDLESPNVFDEALEFIEQMDDQPVAAILGYEELLIALGLGGERERLGLVADLQKQYMDTNDFWGTFQERARRETQVYDRPDDHIPGGLPEPPEPEEPLDEPDGDDDPFSD